MNPHIQRYHQQPNQQMHYRIDLLIALYNGTIDSIRDLATSLETQPADDHVELKLRINRMVVEILDGINDNFGETAPNIRALCAFVLEQVNAGNAEGLQSSIQVLTLLREGFEGVRNEAVEVEKTEAAAVILPSERCLDSLA